MKKHLRIFLFFLISLVVSQSSLAKQVDGFDIPDTMSFESKDLVLNGTGARIVSFFRVKVWVSALYLESRTSNADEILQSKGLKVIDLYPLYEISASDSQKGWKIAFDDNCKPKCSDLQGEIDRFYTSVPEFKKKDLYRYVFTDSGTRVLLNQKEIFSSKDLDFSYLLLSTWIGKNPPTPAVKSGVLGL